MIKSERLRTLLKKDLLQKAKSIRLYGRTSRSQSQDYKMQNEYLMHLKCGINI